MIYLYMTMKNMHPLCKFIYVRYLNIWRILSTWRAIYS